MSTETAVDAGIDRARVHGLLLALAGRVPDDGLAMMRTFLADDDEHELAQFLAAALDSGLLALTEAEEATAAHLATRFGEPVSPLGAELRLDELPPPVARFSAAPDAAEADDGIADHTAIEAATRLDGVHALWRAWRTPPPGASAPTASAPGISGATALGASAATVTSAPTTPGATAPGTSAASARGDDGVPAVHHNSAPTAHGDGGGPAGDENRAVHGAPLTDPFSAEAPTYDPTRPARVFLVEADEDADLVELTAELQQWLAEVGEEPPRVEVFGPHHDLPPYHEAALAGAALLWTAEPDADVRLARVFDGADPATGPFFHPDHPRVDDADRDTLLAYLTAAEAVLRTPGTMPDVVDAERGAVVPMTFRSDGVWIWPDTVAYYLREHGLAPDPALADHIRAADYPPAPLDRLSHHRVMATLAGPPPQPPTWRVD